MDTITLNAEAREHLAKIAKTFRDTHVFTRSPRSKQAALLRARPPISRPGYTEDIGPDIMLVWERVWARDYPNCVKTMDELRSAKHNNNELYISSMFFCYKEMEIIQQEWDIQYPLKLTFMVESMKSQYSWEEYAHQAGLVMYNNKFYGKNARGEPEECVEHDTPTLIGAISTKEQNDAIATFAEILGEIYMI
jgi:hypothetical protein